MINQPGTKTLLVAGQSPAAEGIRSQLGNSWTLREVPGLLDAVAVLARERMDVVLIDRDALKKQGAALDEVRRLRPDTAVVVTAEDSLYVPGVDECVVVPCDQRVLVKALERAHNLRRSKAHDDSVEDERVSLQREVAEQRKRAKMIEEAWERMSVAVHSGDALTRTILEIFSDMSGAKRLSLMLLGEGGKRDLRIIEAQGLSDSVVAATHLRLGEGVAGWVAKTGKPMRSEDGSSDKRRGESKAYHSDTFLSLPLRIGDEVVGVINMTERGGGQPFTDEEVRQLAFLADQTAIWIHHAQKLEQAERQSLMDALTGLFNRRYFMDALDREIERARRNGERFSLAIIDIDHFKAFNDTQGHQAGDDLLRQFAMVMNKNLRASDIVCRYGGEEFAVIMPRTGEAGPNNELGGEHFIDRLRETVSRFPFLGVKDHADGRLTISAGVAVFPHDGETADDLIGAADESLYEAKESGRNRVVKHTRDETEEEETDEPPVAKKRVAPKRPALGADPLARVVGDRRGDEAKGASSRSSRKKKSA